MTDPATPDRLTPSESEAEARRLIAAAYHPDTPNPTPTVTAYRDHTPLPTHGAAPPVHQPDRRVVPEWAAGVAVASIGAGTGAIGIGCGAWLILHGLSSITLWGVLAIAAPFLGAGALAIGIGTAIRSARAGATTTTHVYEGQVTQHTSIQARQRGMFSRTTIT